MPDDDARLPKALTNVLYETSMFREPLASLGEMEGVPTSPRRLRRLARRAVSPS
jgi:phage FluMu protein gp41